MSANEVHRANIESAFNDYLNSDEFFGHIYPGHFYKFCKQHPRYEKINHTLCNRVQLSIERLAIQVEASFRRNAPSVSTYERAKYYYAAAMKCAANGKALPQQLKVYFGDKYGDFTRYVPIKVIDYMYSIGFTVEDLPRFSRDDYPRFFKKMQSNKFSQLSQYVDYMRNRTLDLKVRETTEADGPGFLYCFLANYKAKTKGYNVVKVGCSKSINSRLQSHKACWDEHQIMLLAHTGQVNRNEKKLIDFFEKYQLSSPFYDPKTKRRSPEMFEMPAIYAEKVFAEFLNTLE